MLLHHQYQEETLNNLFIANLKKKLILIQKHTLQVIDKQVLSSINLNGHKIVKAKLFIDRI